jgi:uroporphyrinogen decarboxylase
MASSHHSIMTAKLQNDLFLRACRCEPTPRTPVWIMRQAGRYLPEYRVVRDKYDFLTMVRTPELVAEVTLQPIDIIGVDAAILFSDIMTIPEAMGMHLEMVESRGPVLHDPIRTAAQVDRLGAPDTGDELKYVIDGVRACKQALADRAPLIGFSGSPWTLFVYMVEGSGSKNFVHAKSMVYRDPALAHRLLEKIADVVGEYLVAQAEAGADALQVFDTWGGILTPSDYREFSLAYMARIVERVRACGVPVILFSKDCMHSAAEIAAAGGDVVGVDWRAELASVRRAVDDRVALQGNLDPTVLFSTPGRVRRGVSGVLAAYGQGHGHIFNLGHGILPETPVENVLELVRSVAELSPAYHTSEVS